MRTWTGCRHLQNKKTSQNFSSTGGPSFHYPFPNAFEQRGAKVGGERRVRTRRGKGKKRVDDSSGSGGEPAGEGSEVRNQVEPFPLLFFRRFSANVAKEKDQPWGGKG